MFNRDSYIKHFEDILSLRDLADSTISNYLSYLNQFLDFLEQFLGGKLPEDVTWEEVRTYIHHLTIRSLTCVTRNTFLLFPRSRRWNISSTRCPSQNISVSLHSCIQLVFASMKP